MSADTNEPNVDYGTVLRGVWAGDEEAAADADCSPTKVCRNAREFTFEGIAEDGGDLGSAWKDLLKREGKLSTDSAPSIRDLVLGESND